MDLGLVFVERIVYRPFEADSNYFEKMRRLSNWAYEAPPCS